MKRTDADLINQRSYSCAETRNSVSHTQAAESLHEISVNTPTLRDQFAMSALQGILANQQCAPFSYEGDVEQSVRCAYRLADAMLEARK